MRNNRKTLGTFMTLGLSLRQWREIGLLSREIEVYRRHFLAGWDTTIFSYDRGSISESLGDGILGYSQVPRWLPGRLMSLYAISMPVLCFRKGVACDVIKTNQTNGGWPAVVCGKIWNKPVLARCGYVFGEQVSHFDIRNRHITRAIALEKATFRLATACSVPTERLKMWVVTEYGVNPRTVHVIPNFVDTASFRPFGNGGQSNPTSVRIVCVGRIAKVKRLDLVIDAAQGLPWEVEVVGAGPLAQALTDQARHFDVKLTLAGTIENKQLPIVLNRADVFVIASEYEGHPKALIEAMACGCACVGVDSPGIREVIQDGVNGLLCERTPQGLRAAIQALTSNKVLRTRVCEGARAFACENYAIENIAGREEAVLSVLAGTESQV